MRAVVAAGPDVVEVADVPEPAVTGPGDALSREPAGARPG
jgi:hypothetical protein